MVTLHLQATLSTDAFANRCFGGTPMVCCWKGLKILIDRCSASKHFFKEKTRLYLQLTDIPDIRRVYSSLSLARSFTWFFSESRLRAWVERGAVLSVIRGSAGSSNSPHTGVWVGGWTGGRLGSKLKKPDLLQNLFVLKDLAVTWVCFKGDAQSYLPALRWPRFFIIRCVLRHFWFLFYLMSLTMPWFEFRFHMHYDITVCVMA